MIPDPDVDITQSAQLPVLHVQIEDLRELLKRILKDLKQKSSVEMGIAQSLLPC